MARLALLFGSFRGGGVGTSFLALAEELLGRGRKVDLVVGKAKGDLAERVPTAARIVPWRAPRSWRTSLLITRADPALTLLAGLVKAPSCVICRPCAYLARERPDGLIAATAPFNLIAFWARRLADHTCPLVLSEHNRFALPEGGWRYDCRRPWRAAPMPRPGADRGLRRHRRRDGGLCRAAARTVTTVYNPVAGPHIARAAAQPVAHPWLQQGQPPVVLGVGMLSARRTSRP
ncbi:MAG: glycosyltransferase [Geminicoccaceae bacterium]